MKFITPVGVAGFSARVAPKIVCLRRSSPTGVFFTCNHRAGVFIIRGVKQPALFR